MYIKHHVQLTNAIPNERPRRIFSCCVSCAYWMYKQKGAKRNHLHLNCHLNRYTAITACTTVR